MPSSKPLVRASRRFLVRRTRRALYSSMAVAHSIAVARSHLLFAPVTPKRCFQSLTQPTASPARPRAAISVRPALSPARGGQVELLPPTRHPIGSVNPVTPFVCAFVPGTTRKHAPAASTALLKRHLWPAALPPKTWGPGLAWSYWEHSHQSAAFETPADFGRHRIPFRQPHSLRG